MIVRPAKAEDIAIIHTIMERSDIAAIDADYSRWDGIVLVAERQGEVVGFIQALPSYPYAVITHIAVLPEHQKGRAAVKLIESAELLLRAAGCKLWITYVWEKRTPVRDVVKHWGAEESPDLGYMYKRIL